MVRWGYTEELDLFWSAASLWACVRLEMSYLKVIYLLPMF